MTFQFTNMLSIITCNFAAQFSHMRAVASAFALILGTLLCRENTVFAQMPGGFKPGGQQLNMGRFYGKLIDEKTEKPINGASVQLIQSKMDSVSKKRKDAILSTVISSRKGEFNFEGLSVMGSYKLRITAIGYKSIEQKPSFEINFNQAKSGDYAAMLNAVDKDLGNIRMAMDTLQIQNVTVSATRPLLQLSGEKKIYNVEKDISATGGTALDVMRNVPTLSVDVDGNVSMRNGSPQLFVDGRPTNLALDQIPADQVSTIEIISNPSAKYDASGGGSGILNIVLKKNKKTGYNGNYRASIDSRGKPGTGGDLNLRQGKLNLSLAGMLGFRRTIVTNESERTDFPDNQNVIGYDQSNNPIGNGQWRFVRTGLDIFLDNRNTITINGNASGGNFKNRDLINIRQDSNNIKSISYQRSSYTEAYFRNYGTGISFKHNFTKTGMEWTADANLNYSENENANDFGIIFSGMNPLLQKASGGGSNRFYTFQTDYVNPLPAGQKLEWGARAAIRNFRNTMDNFIILPDGSLQKIQEYATDYGFDERVYATYMSYSKQFKTFFLQTGLRLESSGYTGTMLNESKSNFEVNYPISLFPSLNISRKINQKQDIALNMSRKINRPNFFQLMPFVDSADVLNVSKGNPGLKPEFTQLAEISYTLQYGKGHSLIATVYGRYSQNLISRYQYPDTSLKRSNDTIVVSTFGNASSSLNYGIELIARNKIGKYWELTASLNAFNTEVNANNLPGTFNSSQITWFAKLNNSIKLPGNFSIQINGEYQAKALLPSTVGRTWSGGGGMFFGGHGGFGQTLSTAQGYIEPFYVVDITLKKEFLKNNAASISLNCNDVFRTRINATHASSAFFVQHNERLRDPQLMRLSFNYKFGKVDMSIFKRKNLKGEMENMQNMQQMMSP